MAKKVTKKISIPYNESLYKFPAASSTPAIKQGYVPSKNQPNIDSVARVVDNINSRKADFIRNSLPLPENASQMVAKLTGDARMSNRSLNNQEKSALYHTILNAKKRTGKANGGTEYEDYQNPNGTKEDFNNWFNRGQNSIGTIMNRSGSKTDPYYTMASTVGRGRYWTDPKTQDVYYTDVYDWNSKESSYSGKNLYQNARNLVRFTEDKNLTKEKNDPYRMGFKFNPAEMAEVDKKIEDNKTSGENLGQRMLDLGIQANGGYLKGYNSADRPGGPLVSYYAKKGGKLPQANFTDYSGSQMYSKGGTIHINPANKGKFNATKARTGKTTEELTHSSNPVTKKRAIFAQNAAKWKHENGGPLLVSNQHVAMGGSLKQMYDQGGALNVAYGNGGMVFQNPVGMATKIAQDYKNNQYGNGGTIHIKPENKGKFTAWAQSHNMGVQEAASHVMANKEDYSSTIVKRANFAKNAAGWKHANGGKLNPYTLNIVSNGFKKFGTGGGWIQLPDGSWQFDQESVDLGKNQSLFSTWSQNRNIDQLPAQNQDGIFTLDETQNQREPITDPLLVSKGTDPGFKNQKLAANLYSGGIQAGTSLVANFAEKNQRRQMGAHDDGSADEVIGTAKGMAKGAAIGSNFGPIGTAAGAFIGGVTGYFGGKASGREKKKAYDQWQSDYMKSEQEQAKARAASLQDFKPTASGYYARGGRLPKSYKWKPNTSLLNTPVYDKTPKQMENFSPAVDYAGNVATQTVLDQNPYGKALNIYHTGQDVVKAGKNNEYLKAAGLIGSEFVKLGIPVLGDAAVNSFQEALSPSDNMVKSFMPPKKKAMGGPVDWDKFQNFNKTLPNNLRDDNFKYGDYSHYDLYGMWDAAGKPASFNSVKDTRDFPLQEDGTYHGFSVGNDDIWLKPKSHPSAWMEYKQGQLSTDPYFKNRHVIQREDGRLQYVPNTLKKAMGGSLASNYMSKQKAVGGSLVPLSSDAVEVKGPSHANGGVKLPEIGAEVEGKEVIKDDYVFSEQLGFAKEAKKLAKAKGIVENKPATRERINTLKLLQDKENQLKLAQEFIRKQNNLA